MGGGGGGGGRAPSAASVDLIPSTGGGARVCMPSSESGLACELLRNAKTHGPARGAGLHAAENESLLHGSLETVVVQGALHPESWPGRHPWHVDGARALASEHWHEACDRA